MKICLGRIGQSGRTEVGHGERGNSVCFVWLSGMWTQRCLATIRWGLGRPVGQSMNECIRFDDVPMNNAMYLTSPQVFDANSSAFVAPHTE